jgi:hypothetical protein
MTPLPLEGPPRLTTENWAAADASSDDRPMQERRTKRSETREEALQYLVEAVADRSEVDAVVLVDDAGHIVAGTGMPIEVRDLARVARPIARGEIGAIDRLAEGSDVMARGVRVGETTLYFAALGTRVRKMTDAARAVERILAA